MKQKIAMLCIAAVTFFGLASLSSSACPCTGDSAPCTCGPNCPSCESK